MVALQAKGGGDWRDIVAETIRHSEEETRREGALRVGMLQSVNGDQYSGGAVSVLEPMPSSVISNQ